MILPKLGSVDVRIGIFSARQAAVRLPTSRVLDEDTAAPRRNSYARALELSGTASGFHRFPSSKCFTSAHRSERRVPATTMGKKDKKKKGLGKAKTEAKEAKKSEKARRKNLAQTGEDDVEAILAEILAKEAAQHAVTPVPNAVAPSPRSAYTMVASPVSDAELIFFGGELYNGDRANYFSETYVYNTDKDTWTRYDSATRPPPRSGHSACTHKNFMYIFGGEFSNPSLSQYRHYRDLWRLDVDDMSWEKLDVRGGPTARSGHRMCVAKHKLIVFGGYFDTGFENKYLNDMYYIDLASDELKWTKVDVQAVDVVPSPRSGFEWVANGEDVFLFGGYCKESAKQRQAKATHKDAKKGGASAVEEAMAARGIVHSDMYRLNANTLKWQKVKRSGYGPMNRSGFRAALHKQTMVVFGGVEDVETDEDLESTFHNDLFGFDITRKKWFPMTIRKRKAKAGGRRRRKKTTSPNATNGASSAGAPTGDKTGEGKEVGAQPCGVQPGADDACDVEGELDAGSSAPADGAQDGDEDEEIDPVAMEAMLKQEQAEEVAPCGRFNACIAIQRNVLYISGGVLEKRERDITMDDLWEVDLNKLEEYRLLKPIGEDVEWIDSEDDDSDGSDAEEDASDGGRPGSSSLDGNHEKSDDDEDGDDADSGRRLRRRKANLEARMAQAEDVLTPRVFETLKDYHERTKAHWIGEVHEAMGSGGKELRRIAFEWAYKRYWEVKPTLRELEEIEEEILREAKLEEEFAKAQVDTRRGRNRR